MSYLPELRSSLVRAAERNRQAVRHERGGTIASVLAPRRPRSPFGASRQAIPTALAVLVAVAIAGFALSVLGPGRSPTGAPNNTRPLSPGPPPPSLPSIPIPDITRIYLAQGQAAARDHACSPIARSLPVTSQGSPGGKLLSLLGVLRRPANRADYAYARNVFATVTRSTREVYTRYARPARAFYSARFFIAPAGKVDWFRAVPARCIAEERAALRRILLQQGAAPGLQTLQLQAQFLEWQRYHGAHPQGGVCLAAESPTVGGGSAGVVDCRYSVGDIEQGVASGGPLDSTRGHLFYGVVPDGVARVTVRFSAVQGRHFSPVTATVVGNVWVLAAPRAAHLPSAWIWRAANGRVLRAIRGPG